MNLVLILSTVQTEKDLLFQNLPWHDDWCLFPSRCLLPAKQETKKKYPQIRAVILRKTHCLFKSHLLWYYSYVANFEKRNKCLSKYFICLLPAGEGNCQDIQTWYFCLLSLKIWLDKDRLYKLRPKIHCRACCVHQRPWEQSGMYSNLH